VVVQIEISNFMVDSNKTYIGVVEDNNDPKKMGRVRVRVMDVYDDLEVEDLPWAMPWKDLNGNNFNCPEKGKIVTVIFTDGDENNPEFIYSEHYNINLENKLSKLNESDYVSMKSLLFDHKTQIYVNDSEGLKIDYKYNNLNITDNGIDLNLKDNNRNLNLGDSTADQKAVLGTNFINWLEKFLNVLQSGGLINGGGLAIPNPAMLKVITEFSALKELKFLSHHVNIIDNNKITTVSTSDREDNAQYGDNWTSTKEENDITEVKDEDFTPKPGPKEEYNKPTESATASNTGTSNIQDGVGENSIQIIDNTQINIVNRLLALLDIKGYKIYSELPILNIVALRDKDDGVVTNKFDEILYVFYLRDNQWYINEYNITTVPGVNSDGKLNDGVPILYNGQYIDQCTIEDNRLVFNKCGVIFNSNVNRYDLTNTNIQFLESVLYIDKSVENGSPEFINNSSGSQIFKNSGQFKQFMDICKKQLEYKNTFTYTLCLKSEFEKIDI
jgi:hypothetical protein